MKNKKQSKMSRQVQNEKEIKKYDDKNVENEEIRN